jgi:hypothetical protein
MFAKITFQCPFTSAICILDEGGMNLLNNTKMLLALHSPQIVTIVPFKGRWEHINVWNLTNFLNICHHMSHHDLAFSSQLGAYNGMLTS